MTQTKVTTTITVCFFIILFANTFAQQAVLVSGGNATGTGGSGSYSVGQVAYTNIVGTNGSANQGVQHSYESIVLGIDTSKDVRLLMSVYPNPTNEFAKLRIENSTLENLSYQLYDNSNKLIFNRKITDTETLISMTEIPCGIYFLKVTNRKSQLQFFEIIKNQIK